MKAISLFSCGGIGDLALRSSGFKVIVANELQEDRAEVFKYNFPETEMVIGDIWNLKDVILNISKSILGNECLDLVFATPPCQGMSKNGRGKLLNAIRAGTKNPVDTRNLLVIPTIELFLNSGAHTLVMENVPEMQNTYIQNPKNSELINIIDYIKNELGSEFMNCIRVIEFADYGVPQCRQRLISIFTKNTSLKNYLAKYGTLFPDKTHCKSGHNSKKWVSVRDKISHLPPLDAKCKILSNCSDLEFHRVPQLDEEKYQWVSNTPENKSAFDNQCTNQNCLFDGNPIHTAIKNEDGINKASQTTPIYCIKCNALLPRPWVKSEDSYRLMKGYTSAYKRMSWDSPASTLTRNLSYACSDNKLHPAQNRVLSLHEAMILHTITNYKYEWKRADKYKVSDKLIRELIGESIPPKGLELIFSHIKSIYQNIDVSSILKDEQFSLSY